MRTRWWVAYVIQVTVCLLAFVAAPWLAPRFADAQAALFALQVIAQPLITAALSFLCTLRGVNIILCAATTLAFTLAPPIMLGVTPSGAGMALTAAAAILCSSAGHELRARRT